MITPDGLIIVTNGDDTATLIGVKDSVRAGIVIDAAIGTDDYQYTIVSIEPNALANNSKITEVTIGRNVARVGKRAFYGCSNLRLVEVMSTKLTKPGSVGENSFGKVKTAFKLQDKFFRKTKKILKKKSGAKKAKYKRF